MIRNFVLARLLVFVGCLIVIALFSALIGPYFINWTDYRADFEREASLMLGQPVKVNGTAEARLLPVPSITFSDVQLGDITSDGPRVDVRAFSMDMELAPLLSGDVKIIDMRIDGADAHLTLEEDTTLNWDWALNDRVARADIELENVEITNSRIRITQNLAQRDLEFRAVNGTLSANSLMGPWKGEGKALFAGYDYKGTFSTGTFNTGQPGRIRVDIQPADESYRLQVQGQLEREDDALSYVGDLSFNTEISFGDNAETIAVRAKGPLRMDQKAAVVLPLRIEAGGLADPYVAEGNGSLFLEGEPRFALSLDGQQINLDRFIEQPQAENETQESDASAMAIAPKASKTPMSRAYQQFSDMILMVPKPTLFGDLALNVPAIIQGEQVYRNITLNVTPSPNGWDLKKFSGELPGRTRVEASGLLSTEERFTFDGDFVFASRQPSGLAQWLTGKVDDDIRKIPVLGFSSRVSLSETRQNLRELELQLGQDNLTGLIDRLAPQDATNDALGETRPRIVFRLAGDALNLDALSAFGRLVRDVAGTDESAHDLDIAIKADTLKGFGTSAQGVAAEFLINDNAVTIKSLSLDDLAGAEISGMADIRDIDQTPNGAFNVTVQGEDLAPSVTLMRRLTNNHPFFTAIEKRVAIDPEFLTEASLSIDGKSTLVGQHFDLDAKMDAFVGGTELKGQIEASGQDIGLAQGRVELNASNERGERILSLLGVPSQPLDTLSRLELTFAAEGALKTGMNVTADISSNESDEQVRFEGIGRFKDGRMSGDGTLSTTLIDADPYIAAMGIELPGTGLGKGMSLNSRMGFNPETLTFDALNGRLGVVDITGNLTVDVTKERPLFKGALFTSEFDTALFMDALWGQGYRFVSTLDGGSLLRSKLDFAAGMSSNIDFDVMLRAREIMFDDLMRAKDAKMHIKLDASGSSIEDFEATIDKDERNGRLTGALFAQNENGQLILNGRFYAEKLSAKAFMSELFSIDVIDGALDVAGSIAGRGTSFETLMAGLAGSGNLSLGNGSVDGVSETDIALYLKPSDAKREGLNQEEINALAARTTLSGALNLPALDATFSLANGRLRLPPLSITLDRAMINADFSASLAQSDIEARANLQMNAGNDAQSGSIPAIEFAYVGRFEDAKLDISTQPLTQFLQQRALEREQIRVAKQQAALLEKQRLRREIRYFEFLEKEKTRKAEETRLLEEQAALQRAEETRLREEQLAKERADIKRAEEVLLKEEERQRAAQTDDDRLNAAELDAVIKELDRLENENRDPVKQLIDQATEVAKPKVVKPQATKVQTSKPKITQFPATQF